VKTPNWLNIFLKTELFTSHWISHAISELTVQHELLLVVHRHSDPNSWSHFPSTKTFKGTKWRIIYNKLESYELPDFA
jgi:hypothetical protein